MRIVIVEDSGLMAKILTLLIEKSGSSVIGRASSAAEAMTLIRDRRPDAVTMDLTIEGGGSLELIEDVSALGVPVIVVSGAAYPGSPAVTEALWHGASGCVDKAALCQSDVFTRELEAAAAWHPAHQHRLAS